MAASFAGKISNSNRRTTRVRCACVDVAVTDVPRRGFTRAVFPQYGEFTTVTCPKVADEPTFYADSSHCLGTSASTGYFSRISMTRSRYSCLGNSRRM